MRKSSVGQISSEPQAYYTVEEKLSRTGHTAIGKGHSVLLDHKLPHQDHSEMAVPHNTGAQMEKITEPHQPMGRVVSTVNRAVARNRNSYRGEGAYLRYQLQTR